MSDKRILGESQEAYDIRMANGGSPFSEAVAAHYAANAPEQSDGKTYAAIIGLAIAFLAVLAVITFRSNDYALSAFILVVGFIMSIVTGGPLVKSFKEDPAN